MQESLISNSEKQRLLKECRSVLLSAKANLAEISKTCCMPERSSKMQIAFDYLEQALLELSRQDGDEVLGQYCQEHIAQCGGVIGYLNVSCCTETREPLYKTLLQNLQTAYVKIFALLGQGH